MEIYDLHCHVDLMPSMVEFSHQTQKAGIGILAVTTTPKAYEKEVVALRRFNNLKLALGLHPQLISERYNELPLIERYIGDTKYIGEVGVDFNTQFYSSKGKQVKAFENIIGWCSQINGKVISIHSVRSDKIVLDILEKNRCTEKINAFFIGFLVRCHSFIEQLKWDVIFL